MTINLKKLEAGSNIFRDTDLREIINGLIDEVVRLGAGEADRINPAQSSQQRLIPVELTAGGSATGYFQFKEKFWNPVTPGWEDVAGGLTHTLLGEAYCSGGLPGGGMGMVFLGEVVYLQRKGMVNSDTTPIFEFDAPPTIMPVDVTQVGGADGDDSNPATWTYDVYAEDGVKILSAVSPQNQRPDVGTVKAGSQGEAHYEIVAGIPTTTLGIINEMPNNNSDLTGYDALEGEDGSTASELTGGTIKFDGALTGAHIDVKSAVSNGGLSTDTVNLWIVPADLPNPITVPSTTVTVITDVQVVASTKKLQYKTRLLTVQVKAAESAWIDFHTGVECTT